MKELLPCSIPLPALYVEDNEEAQAYIQEILKSETVSDYELVSTEIGQPSIDEYQGHPIFHHITTADR